MIVKVLIGVACSLLLFNFFLMGACGYKTYINVDNALQEKQPTLDVQKLQFDHYLKDFHKRYYGAEYNRRFENFKTSLKNIAIQNKKEGKQVAKLTEFSDADPPMPTKLALPDFPPIPDVIRLFRNGYPFNIDVREDPENKHILRIVMLRNNMFEKLM